MEAKGKAYMIGCKASGKNGIGMIAPAKNSITDVDRMRIPIGDIV